MPNQRSMVGGGWQPFCISPETAGWERKCETGPCHSEAARTVLAKVRGDVFARFHAVAAKVAVEPVIHSLACWDRCFALPQLLCRWQHQSGIFWIPPCTCAIHGSGFLCRHRHLYQCRWASGFVRFGGSLVPLLGEEGLTLSLLTSYIYITYNINKYTYWIF
jgi:hypothetical protein